MLIMNHILRKNIGVIKVPDRAAAVVTNSADDIIKQAWTCSFKWSKFPRGVLLEFFYEDFRIDIGQLTNARRWT
jgi:hypothetical protein